jgi:hypothetical protein
MASRSYKPSRHNVIEIEDDQTTTIENTLASNVELKGSLHKRHKSTLSNYRNVNMINMNSNSTLDQRSGSQMRGNPSRKVLDYACGDPFYNIKKEQKEEYQRVHGLDRAIGETMQNLKLYPRLRQNIVCLVELAGFLIYHLQLDLACRLPRLVRPW